MNAISPATRETVFGNINELMQGGVEASTQPASGADRLANKEVFLQLLVAQLKNQNPLNPADGTQFVAQLAQFTQLEQTMAMRQELEKIRAAVEGSKDAGAKDTTTP